MMTLELPIKIGNKYVRRDGRVVTAGRWNLDLSSCPYVTSGSIRSESLDQVVSRATGKAYEDRDSPADLIASVEL